MELQRVVWIWEPLVYRLKESEPELGKLVGRSCRPIEAERRRDGRLILVLGSWSAQDRSVLAQEVNRSRLDNAIGEMLEDRVQVVLAPWPGGLAPAGAKAVEGEIPPPDILANVSMAVREEGMKCESPIQRLFLARAIARGLPVQCQYSVLTFRLDFALPRERVAAEVAGWDWHRSGRGQGERREREQFLSMEGWQVIWFSGAQVLEDPNRCVEEFAALAKAAPIPRSKGPGPKSRGSQPRFPRSRS